MGMKAAFPCASLLVKDIGCYDDGRTRVGTVALAMEGGLLISIPLDETCSLGARPQLSYLLMLESIMTPLDPNYSRFLYLILHTPQGQ